MGHFTDAAAVIIWAAVVISAGYWLERRTRKPAVSIFRSVAQAGGISAATAAAVLAVMLLSLPEYGTASPDRPLMAEIRGASGQIPTGRPEGAPEIDFAGIDAGPFYYIQEAIQ